MPVLAFAEFPEAPVEAMKTAPVFSALVPIAACRLYDCHDPIDIHLQQSETPYRLSSAFNINFASLAPRDSKSQFEKSGDRTC